MQRILVPMATVKCVKCGGENELDSGVKFITCRYCGSQMYIDKSGAGFYYILPFQPGFLTNEQVQGQFRRWTAGPRMARDLETQARIIELKPQYFPVYMFKRSISGNEIVLVHPARSTTLPGMHSLKVPAGDIKIFDKNYNTGGIELLPPDIQMTAYLQSLSGDPIEQALVYFPIWSITYQYNGRNYSVVIDGSSGEFFAGEFPPRSETPFIAIGIGGFAAFFAEGVVSILLMLDASVIAAMMLVTFAGVLVGSYLVAKKM